jgi:hypothetical protein
MLDRTTSRLTPIDDAYPSCERTCARLLVYPGSIDPRDLTGRLGLVPTSVTIKGTETTNSLGRVRVAPLNGWFFSSETFVDSRDVRRHIDWLVERMDPARDAILALQGEPGVRMAVSCVWWSKAGSGGPVIWPEQMRRLAALNLECGFEVAFFGDE